MYTRLDIAELEVTHWLRRFLFHIGGIDDPHNSFFSQYTYTIVEN